MRNKILLSLIGALVIFSSFLVGKVNTTSTPKFFGGSPGVTAFIATSTALNTVPNFTALCSKTGTLGSVIVTNAAGASANGRFTLYDATTTITNGLWATSTIASFATNVAIGTYPINSVFAKGLLLEYDGAMSSTTITYSCGS